MKYWVSFGAFQAFEIVSDVTISFILPFYIELKLLSILWMVLGTKLIFDTIVNRELSRREKTIDRWLNKISKCRDELLAILWLEFSQCSVKILSALMTGGLSVLLVKTPESSNRASPIYSDEDEMEIEPIKTAEKDVIMHEINGNDEQLVKVEVSDYVTRRRTRRRDLTPSRKTVSTELPCHNNYNNN